MKHRPVFWLLLHLLAGVVLANMRSLSTFWGAGAFFYFLIKTLQTRNRTGWAHFGAAYIIGLEVLLRMAKASLFWEFGKLAAAALMATGMLVERRRNVRWGYLFMVLLLMPALFLSDVLDFSRFRQEITFQLGGQILLVLSCIYFAGRVFSVNDFQNLSRWMLYPISSMVVYLFLRTPNLSEITFGTTANFATSGGFGPNQVSTTLGLGILLLLINYILRLPALFSVYLDRLLLLALIFRGLLTFSRGGVMGAAVAIFVGYLAYLFAKRAANRWKIVFRFFVGGAIFALLFLWVDSMTGNMLYYRFAGLKVDPTTMRLQQNSFDLESASSGRTKIIETDLEMWLDHFFLGVGVGISNELRPLYGYRNISHTEPTRLLAEHGLLGLFFLLWLLYETIKRGLSGSPIRRLISFTLMALVLFTMLHSATRLAMTGFLFGLGMINWYNSYAHTLHRQSPFHQRQLSLRS